MLSSDGADHSPWKGWLGIEYDANTYWQELALSSLTGCKLTDDIPAFTTL